ncbi:MAG: trigger factor [Opitutaceae bacterium]|nr:trigger factor [Opitutaceae bacterium]
MNTAVQDQSITRKNLVVSLDAAEVSSKHAATVAEFVRYAKIPGFRPGKAPMAVIAKRFEKDIADEFKQKVVAEAYREGVEKSKLDILNLVQANPGTIENGKPAELTFSIDVRPEFEVPDYSELTTEVGSTEVSDAEIDQVIERLRSERADFKVADRASQKGDYIKLSYEGIVDGKPILELVPEKQIYGKVPQTWEEVDGEQEGLIPGLGKQLSGMRAGEKKEVAVQFPAEFHGAPELAGKAATYSVEILEVRERVLPEIDEAFLKTHEAGSVEELRDGIRGNLRMQKEYQNRTDQRRQVIESLLQKTDFEIPSSLVEVETQNVLRRFIEENMRRGVTQDQFEKDKKELFESARRSAASRVKSQLILSKIAEKEDIKVSENDINQYIIQESQRSHTAPDKLLKQLSGDRSQLRSVHQDIIFDKAVEFLVSKAKVVNKS